MPAPRPLNRRQALENAAFLRELRRTGNAREAARTLGIHRATLTRRRAKHPAFAAEWDAALAIASAALGSSPARGGGPSAKPMVEGGQPQAISPPPQPDPHLVQTRTGLQLRTGKARRVDRAAEQAFLAALSATANIRLSAAAAGFAHSSFYARRRRDPGFAREMQLALQMGYERLEMALLESFEVEAHAHDAWRHNDPPPIPPMTANQALQLLYLHHKTAKLQAEAPHMKARRGETTEAWSERRAADYRAAKAREAEALKIAATDEALRKALGRVLRGRLPHEPDPPALPALDQVQGWSKGDAGRAGADPGRALFGGWRLGE